MKDRHSYFLNIVNKIGSRRLKEKRERERLLREQSLKSREVGVEEEFNTLFDSDNFAEIVLLPNNDIEEVSADTNIYGDSFETFISSLRAYAEKEVNRIQESQDIDAIETRARIAAARDRFRETIFKRYGSKALRRMNGLLTYFDKWPERMVDSLMRDRLKEDIGISGNFNQINLSFFIGILMSRLFEIRDIISGSHDIDALNKELSLSASGLASKMMTYAGREHIINDPSLSRAFLVKYLYESMHRDGLKASSNRNDVERIGKHFISAYLNHKTPSDKVAIDIILKMMGDGFSLSNFISKEEGLMNKIKHNILVPGDITNNIAGLSSKLTSLLLDNSGLGQDSIKEVRRVADSAKISDRENLENADGVDFDLLKDEFSALSGRYNFNFLKKEPTEDKLSELIGILDIFNHDNIDRWITGGGRHFERTQQLNKEEMVKFFDGILSNLENVDWDIDENIDDKLRKRIAEIKSYVGDHKFKQIKGLQLLLLKLKKIGEYDESKRLQLMVNSLSA